MAIRISKNSQLTDIVSINQKPLIRKSDSVQFDYHEIPNYPVNTSTGEYPNMSFYEKNPAFNGISTDHPTDGSSVILQLWLFNDNAAKRYENIRIEPSDISNKNESNWIQLAPDNAGSAGAFIAAGATLNFANISDNNVAKPFWVKVTTPSVTESQNKSNIQLAVKSREHAL